MSCHRTDANKGAANLAIRATGLPRQAVERAFHALKTEAKRAGAQPPTPDDWQAHLNKQSRLAGVLLEAKDRPLVHAQITRAESEFPDADSFYAQQNLLAECYRQKMAADDAAEQAALPPAPTNPPAPYSCPTCGDPDCGPSEYACPSLF